MDLLANLGHGFAVAFSAQNLAYCFVGVVLGTLIGVLPGISPLVAIGMLFPLTFTLPPVASLIMLAGIYYGAQYGGAITSILLNTPGETASAVTCLDGYPMARQGRAGPALAIAALASFFAGCVCTLMIALAGPPLARVGAEVRPGRVLLADADGAGGVRRPDPRRPGQGARHGRARSPARPRRHRRQLRRGALLVRRARAHRRHRLHGDRRGALRGGGDREQPGTKRAATRCSPGGSPT